MLAGCGATFSALSGSIGQKSPLVLWPTPPAIAYGTPLGAAQLNATTGVPGTFNYSPAQGTVLSAGAQTLTVTFTPTNTLEYASASASVTLTVNTVASILAWSAPAAISYGAAISPTQLNATANLPGIFVYTPSAGAYLTAGVHILSLTFIPTDETDYAAATVSVPITVIQSAPVLAWPAPSAISYGTATSSAQLNATASVLGSFAYTPASASVLTAGIHTLSVVFTPADTQDYSAATANVSLTVNATTPVLTWPAPAAISYGAALNSTQLNAAANVPGTFVYSPSAGTILTSGSHTLLITFTPTDSQDYTTATASVPLTVAPVQPILVWPVPAAVAYGTALSALQLNATASIPGTFVYSPSLGAMLTAGSQTLSVTFTPTDAVDYKPASATVPLTVNPIQPVINWRGPAAISYGTPLTTAQLNATTSVPGTFAYSPAAGTVLRAGSQTLSVTFTPADAVDYKPASASVPLTVNPIQPVLSWRTPSAISYGTALTAAQLNATASIPGAFVYSPAAGTVLTAGSHTLAVTFTPTDSVDYLPAAGTANLVINPVTPTLTWVPSDLVAVGVPLGASQLNAIASASGITTPIAGTFQYTPAAGTVFNSSGPQTLSVTFAPADSVDFTPAAASIQVNVSAFGVAAWGDSLTYGNNGLIDRGVYPTQLQNLIALPVKNLGVQKQTSLQIGIREGAIPTTVSIAGGVIPASGSITATFPAGYEPISSVGPRGGIGATILGVHGQLTSVSVGVFSFTRSTPGSAVSAPGNPSFVVDTPYAGYIPIFWEGRNDATKQAQVLADLAAQVATVPSGQTYLVISVTNDNVDDEWIGGVGYKQVVSLNNQLANLYGSHYLDLRSLLVAQYNPDLITDVSDYQHDEPPTSLRAIVANGTLVNPIGPTDTVLTVNLDSTIISIYNILTVDSGDNAENMVILAVSGNQVTVKRNYGGLNTSHAAGVPITETDYIHFNAQGYQVVANAVADFLSAYADPVQ